MNIFGMSPRFMVSSALSRGFWNLEDLKRDARGGGRGTREAKRGTREAKRGTGEAGRRRWGVVGNSYFRRIKESKYMHTYICYRDTLTRTRYTDTL